MDEPTRLATDWIAYWEHKFRTGNFPPSSHVDDLDDAVYNKPDLAWEAIKVAVAQLASRPDRIESVEVLAAGPVEDLLRDHGPSVIDRIETEARRNPAFNYVLGGVWATSIAPEVWERVEQIRNEAW
jgi:hypothetical protein